MTALQGVRSLRAASSELLPWTKLTLDLISADPALSPPRAARAAAIVHVAINKALVANHAASEASVRAAIAAAASTTLAYVFPSEAPGIQAMAEEAYQPQKGKAFKPIANARRIGEAAAQEIIARAKTDGAEGEALAEIPEVYRRFLPGFGWTHPNPVEPTTGTWRPWGLKTGSQFRLLPPPAPGSPQLDAEIEELLEMQAQRTPEQIAIVRKWADRPGAVLWNQIAVDLSLRHGLDSGRTAHMLGLLNAIMADAFIAAWDTKFVYYQPRPDMLEPRILPVIRTPAHPSFPSGHATLGAAAARYLASVFPKDASFLYGQSTEGAESRLYAGIHFRSDTVGGQRLGEAVADYLMQRADRYGILPK